MQNQQPSINKDLKKSLSWSIFATCSFILGVPMIVFGAIKGFWALLAIGVVGVLFGFYGSTFFWINYGEKRITKRVVYAVTEEHIYSIKEISKHLMTSALIIKKCVQTAIKKKYLNGFIFDGEKLTPNDRQPAKRNLVHRDCANCGGTLTKVKDEWICDYCGSVFRVE